MLRQGTYQVPTRGLLDAIYNSGALAIGYETDSQEVANLPGLTSTTWPLCRTAFASRVTDNLEHRNQGFTALHHCLASSTPSSFRSSGPSRSRTCSNREALLHHKLSVPSRTCACVSMASAYQSCRCASSCFCPFFVRYGVIFVTNSSRTIDT